MGRFLNADAFASTGQGFLGNNMFAYCNNNPVTYADPEGNLPEGIINPNAMARNSGCSLRPISDKERKEQYLQKQARKLFNTSEEAVLAAEHYAFYKGALIVKVLGDDGFFYGVIFLGSNANDVNLVKHEYGHYIMKLSLHKNTFFW